ncbi:hypothetical protein iF6_190 [Enterococcus phage iF6]|uniref:Uncharacterized protein n=1 Tax=Enterococcus phage iF6 TaxID=2765371 RepID=A0A7G8ZZB8_9CAUD|nr:hypothetical protein iF6_3 [Enterococcus phage iF6]QNL29549.1 hypothetical protein iF6_190 [Enterococcus phage iF6]
MTKQLMNEALDYLKAEGRQITRKHVKQYGFTMYEHPTYSSAIIMVKDDRIVGQTNKAKILADNSRTREKLEKADFQEFKL